MQKLILAIVTAFFVACAPAPSPTPAGTGQLDSLPGPVLVTNSPTEQSLTLPPDYDHGEVNMQAIRGELVCKPGDVFGNALRVSLDNHCPTDVEQRAGVISAELHLNNASGGPDGLAAIQCIADGGTRNNCLEAHAGDVVVHAGDVYANQGNIYASSGYLAGQRVYAWGGYLGLSHAGGLSAIAAYAAPPTDTQPRGSLAIDAATPALWISTGESWIQIATSPAAAASTSLRTE